MDFIGSVKQAFLQGSPWALLIALVGALMQLIYVALRDRSNYRSAKIEQDLAKAKFEYQKSIEELKFGYEQRRWREQLAIQLATKHVEIRLKEYASLWARVEVVARHKIEKGDLTPDVTRTLAGDVKNWRYSAGGLLAEEATRDSAFAFQQALWDYDGTDESYKRIRTARKILRDTLRTDMGVSENMAGKSIIDLTQERQKIRSELAALQHKLGIVPDLDR